MSRQQSWRILAYVILTSFLAWGCANDEASVNGHATEQARGKSEVSISIADSLLTLSGLSQEHYGDYAGVVIVYGFADAAVQEVKWVKEIEIGDWSQAQIGSIRIKDLALATSRDRKVVVQRWPDVFFVFRHMEGTTAQFGVGEVRVVRFQPTIRLALHLVADERPGVASDVMEMFPEGLEPRIVLIGPWPSPLVDEFSRWPELIKETTVEWRQRD